MSDKALLPCPFCGATDDKLIQAYTRATDDVEFWSVECSNCGVEIADDEGQELANQHWNTRVQSTSPGGAEEWSRKHEDIVAAIHSALPNLDAQAVHRAADKVCASLGPSRMEDE